MSENIICLGKTFTSEDERREFFREELRKKLPELKKIDGFPIGEDEDIIALSDPPYYTACPNPWLNDFIEEWVKEKINLPGYKKDFHVEEPYANDISEGKNNPIYNAHSYHTKVPHPAIMRYILHYTQPGDIVFDGFAGTGMTGVACQFCDDPGNEQKYVIEEEWTSIFGKKPLWGNRKAICGELSPVASFIAANYNTPIDVLEFANDATTILNDVETRFGWMMQSENNLGGKSRINYTVWSDVFICPNCHHEIVFYDVAVKDDGKVLEEFKCHSCSVVLSKKEMEKAWITIYDQEINQHTRVQKTVPVLINYSIGKRNINKSLQKSDFDLISQINSYKIENWIPIDRMMHGNEARRNDRSGITHIHQFYSRRNLIYLSEIKKQCNTNTLMLLFTSQLINLSKLNRFRPGVSFPYNPLSGTLYIGSQISEANVYIAYLNKIEKLKKALSAIKTQNLTTTNSATDYSLIKDNSIDYIFIDPPFGANISYSELNYIWESWLKVKTNYKYEAIENQSHEKTLNDYLELMTKCFKEYYRILKPNKWMTVEFSNTSASVWNGIQTSLQKVGFVIANVAALDKQQGSFKAVTTTTAVKQDLIISCYKPSIDFGNKYRIEAQNSNSWDFIKEHLNHLPIHFMKNNKTTTIIERNPKILYDRLITFYLMRGLNIPLDAADFQEGLRQQFVQRDGMYFTQEQVMIYDREKVKHGGAEQLSLFEIYTENDAVQYLKECLAKRIQTYQDLMPEFRKLNQVTRKGEFEIELKTVLEENFIQEKDGKWRVPNMNEAKDREALRNKSLLREFNRYLEELNNAKTKKIKEVRVEALRAGFKMCWEKKDFQTIVSMGDKIPQNILLEDEQLLMYYDIAKDRI